MREFKFRAWHSGNTDMSGSYAGYVAPQMIYETYSGECFAWKNLGQPIRIMQSTGLKDKSGKEIYEGDCLYDDGNDEYFQVWFNGAVGVWTITDSDGVSELLGDYNESCSVVGNIYENSELLNRGV